MLFHKSLKMMKLINFCVALMLGVTCLQGQSQDTKVMLTGKVSINAEQLGGILITVEGQNTGTITDAKGQFELFVPAGNQTIMFRVAGVMRHYQSAEFFAGKKYQWDVKIGPLYSQAYIIRMKNEGTESELVQSEVTQKIWTQVKGSVLFDDMKLASALVNWKEGQGTSTTDSDGNFSIWLESGTQTIEFSFTGFDPFTFKLKVEDKNNYTMYAKFGPPYSKAHLEQMRKEGRESELIKPQCEVITQ
jgi:hypothetical protein